MTTKEKCLTLRNKGLTLGEIIKTTNLPKTTIYYHIKSIPLLVEVKERVRRKNTRRINEFNIKTRKGKCAPGRIVIKPKGWTNELIFLVAHFMFDGLEKKVFLKVFFDDEGCVRLKQRKRLVRGYQHNLTILRLVKKLLKDFDIESKIDEKYKEIVISRKPNLIKFRNKINFSRGIYINPNRKNSIWKKRLEKRKILDYIINSYQN